MTLFTEVAPLWSVNGNNNLYDEDGMAQDDEFRHHYISSDPFSKLKFDDLRKVHKDQTIFAVSERDISKVPQYSSVDHYSRERNRQSLTPLEKQEAQRILQQRELEQQKKISQKEFIQKLVFQ